MEIILARWRQQRGWDFNMLDIRAPQAIGAPFSLRSPRFAAHDVYGDGPVPRPEGKIDGNQARYFVCWRRSLKRRGKMPKTPSLLGCTVR